MKKPAAPEVDEIAKSKEEAKKRDQAAKPEVTVDDVVKPEVKVVSGNGDDVITAESETKKTVVADDITKAEKKEVIDVSPETEVISTGDVITRS